MSRPPKAAIRFQVIFLPPSSSQVQKLFFVVVWLKNAGVPDDACTHKHNIR